jgi:DUF1680 family protein
MAGNVPVTLSQTGAWPEGENQEFQIDSVAPAEFALNIRVPRWLEREPEFRVNGKKFTVTANRGSFASIQRRWKKGDRVEAHFPLRFRLEPVDDRHPDMVAAMRGAVMYVGLDAAGGADGTFARLPGDLEAERAKSALLPFYAVKEQAYNTYFQRGG